MPVQVRAHFPICKTGLMILILPCKVPFEYNLQISNAVQMPDVSGTCVGINVFSFKQHSEGILMGENGKNNSEGIAFILKQSVQQMNKIIRSNSVTKCIASYLTPLILY